MLGEERWSFILVNKENITLGACKEIDEVAGGASGICRDRITDKEDITLGACEEIDEVAGGACGMRRDRVEEFGDRASEGQTADVHGTGFTAGSQARIGAVTEGGRGSRLLMTRS